MLTDHLKKMEQSTLDDDKWINCLEGQKITLGIVFKNISELKGASWWPIEDASSYCRLQKRAYITYGQGIWFARISKGVYEDGIKDNRSR